MATDFAPYANLRLLIPQPAAAPVDFRSGVPVSSAKWVIEAFVKGPTGAAPVTPSIDPRTRTLEGYITSFATLPANTAWLAASSAFTWDTTGLAPAGMLVGASGRGILGALDALPLSTAGSQQGEVKITAIGGAFGAGGIGAELRAQLGDAITVNLQVAG